MRVSLVLTTILLSGCVANGFEKFYTPMPGSEKVSSSPWFEKPPAVPKVYAHSADPNTDAKRLAEEGYVMIGTSSFFGPSKNGRESLAVEQGKRVGAALVMVKSTYKDTLTGTLPFTVPNPPRSPR